METAPPGSVTSTTLLQGLRDPSNRTVWRHYVDRYRPLVVRYAVKLGLPRDEAEDAAQATLLAFSAAYRAGKYERAKGRLSSWLFGIAKNEIRSQQRRAGAGASPGAPDPAVLEELESESELDALWEREWQDAVLAECMQLVRRELEPRTLRAFELFALEERTAEDVARELGLTPNAVFGAKRRVMQRIRELHPLVEDTW